MSCARAPRSSSMIGTRRGPPQGANDSQVGATALPLQNRELIAPTTRFEEGLTQNGLTSRFELLVMNESPRHAVFRCLRLPGIMPPKSICDVLAGPDVPSAGCLAYENVNKEHSRGDRIRTCGLLVPNQALYQAELRPGEEAVSDQLSAVGQESIVVGRR